jgi:hypothetical protein
MHRRGLEPLTTRFEAGYSIRLSYRCEKDAFSTVILTLAFAHALAQKLKHLAEAQRFTTTKKPNAENNNRILLFSKEKNLIIDW